MKHLLKGLSLTILFFVTSLGANSENPNDVTQGTASTPAERHITHASWYGKAFIGRITTSGKEYKEEDIFVAHRTYPIGTKLLVTNLRNHRSIVVAVEDRGPFNHPGRDLDLSYQAAKLLDMLHSGVVLVSYIKLT